MHHLLERQLKKYVGADVHIPEECMQLLEAVSTTYEGYDQDRRLLDHSFDISSKEFSELHAKVLALLSELQSEKESVERKVVERTQELHLKIEELDASNRLLSQQEAQLTEANTRLLELDKVKSEFISVAAHQLRTPLSAIKWALSLMCDDSSENLTIDQRSLILKAYASTERTINLINKMLVVTRIESGKLEYELTLVHIEHVIESVLLDFAGYVSQHHVTLEFEPPQQELPPVKIDSEKIRAVLQNLIENALSYTKSGGKVMVRATRNSNHIVVSVSDTGIGIPEHQKSAIFTKFFRADNALKAKTDGTGLGLFVAKNIVDKHGGTISFESKEGEGTTFYFSLPIPLSQ